MKRIVWSVLLVLAFRSFAFSAPAAEDVESVLQTTFLGKTMIFRNFYRGETLHYSAEGRLIKGGKADSWTLYSMFIPTKIRFQKNGTGVSG